MKKSLLQKCSAMFLLLALGLLFVGCVKEPVIQYTEIKTVLETAANNDDVNVEGIVYGIVNNGFYISDSDMGKIFVIMGSAWTKDVELGDKVQLTGKFGVFSNMPQIKTVTAKTVVSQNNTLPLAVDATIEDVIALSNSAKTGSYGKLVKLIASIGINPANNITLVDSNGKLVLVNSESNTPALNLKLDARVTVEVIIHDFNSIENSWRVSFVGNAASIVDTPLTFENLKALAIEDINERVSTNVYGKIELPTSHPTISSLTYTWSVLPNEYLSIDNQGVATVILPLVDVIANLTVNISSNTDNYEYSFEVTIKNIPSITVKELLDDLPDESGNVVVVKGVVISIFRNQTSSLRTFLLKDPVSQETISIDFSRVGTTLPPKYGSIFEDALIKLGDEIVITGELRVSSRKTIANVTVIERTRENVEYEHDYENALVLNDAASYASFTEENLNKLVKVENPYFNYSSSTVPTATNWVRFGYDVTSPNAAHGTTNKVFALQIGANDDMLETQKWRNMYDIPLFNAVPEQFSGAFYAYATYVSDTYVTFIVPSIQDWQFYGEESIRYDIQSTMPTVVEGNSITLINQHPEIVGLISWESSSDVIDVTTGVVKTVFENVNVTLTCRFTIEDQEYEFEFVVSILSGQTMSVSDLLRDANDKDSVKVTGIFGAYHSDGNASVNNHGIIIFDEVTGESVLVMGVQNLNAASVYGAYLTSDGTQLAYGDKIELIAVYEAATARNYLMVNADTNFSVVSNENVVLYDIDNAIVIENNADMLGFAENLQYGKLIKFVGTVDNPICIGGSSSNMPFNMKLFYNASAAVNDDTKYLGKIFSFKTDVNVPNLGAAWWDAEFGIPGAFVGPNSTNAPILYTGTIYAMLSNATATYYQLVFVNPDDLNITRLP